MKLCSSKAGALLAESEVITMADVYIHSTVCYSEISEDDQYLRIVRLLHLSSTRHPIDEGIQCKLATVSLNDFPSYEALSYTWGEPDDLSHKIWLNGIRVGVRQNLWDALCALRPKSSGDRVLWIDALCINQSDTKERNHQVGIMGEIFRSAKKVIVWLGVPTQSDSQAPSGSDEADTEFSTPAFSLLSSAAADASSIHLQDQKWQRSLMQWYDKFAQPAFEVHWQQLTELCYVPYWYRLWILQEIGLASEIELHYGRFKCSWNDFSTVLMLLTKYKSSFSSPLASSGFDTHAAYAISQSPAAKLHAGSFRKHDIWRGDLSLESLLSLSENSYCQERKDRIYGILGLTSPTVRKMITVDYSQPLFRLYEDVIKFQSGQDPSGRTIVSFSQLLQRALLAPLTFDSGPCEMSFLESRKGDSGQYEAPDSKAAGKENCDIQRSVQKRQLVWVEAEMIGEVSPLHVQPRDIHITRENAHPLFNSDPTFNWSEFDTDFMRKSDYTASENGTVDLYAMKTILREIWRADHNIIAESSSLEHGVQPHLGSKLTQRDMALRLTLFEPKGIFRPTKNCIGIAPSNIQTSDFICRFPLSDIVAIIRPKSKPNNYRIVGRAIIAFQGVVRNTQESNWPQPVFDVLPQNFDRPFKGLGPLPPPPKIKPAELPIQIGPHIAPPRGQTIRLETTIDVLQALTCPLKPRAYDEDELVRHFDDPKHKDAVVLI